MPDPTSPRAGTRKTGKATGAAPKSTKAKPAAASHDDNHDTFLPLRLKLRMRVGPGAVATWKSTVFRDEEGRAIVGIYRGTIRDDRKKHPKLSLVNLGIQPLFESFVFFTAISGREVRFHNALHDAGVEILGQWKQLQYADPDDEGTHPVNFLSFSRKRKVRVLAIRLGVEFLKKTKGPLDLGALLGAIKPLTELGSLYGHTVSPPPPAPGDAD